MKHLIMLDKSELTEIINKAVQSAVASVIANTASPDEVEYITRKQAADLLRVTVTTIDAWTKQGRLTKYRIGGAVRFKKSEVLDAYKCFPKYQREKY